jgi:hypothetical protein
MHRILIVLSILLFSMSANAATYGGGRLLDRPQVVSVQWNGSAVPSAANATYQAFTSNASIANFLTEYNQPPYVFGYGGNYGSYTGPISITPVLSTGTSLNDGGLAPTDDVGAELEYQILAGRLPYPNSETVYMVHFSAAYSLFTPAGQSCVAQPLVGWCGFHYNKSGFAYALLPTCAANCGEGHFGLTQADALGATAGHELIESMTDPLSNAWGGPEIGDDCLPQFGVYPPTHVHNPVTGLPVVEQYFWSNVAGRCVAPEPTHVCCQANTGSSAPCYGQGTEATCGYPGGANLSIPIALGSLNRATISAFTGTSFVPGIDAPGSYYGGEGALISGTLTQSGTTEACFDVPRGSDHQVYSCKTWPAGVSCAPGWVAHGARLCCLADASYVNNLNHECGIVPDALVH